MSSLTDALRADAHALAIALAGDDFRWETDGAPSQLDSKHRQGLTILLTKAQNGICAACGDGLDGEVTHLCHIVASRVSGRGVMAFNVYVGHASCNDDDAKVYGDIVPIASMVRPELIPTSFPSRKACHAAADEKWNIRAARRERRASRID